MPDFRRASTLDIPRLIEIRFAVQENRLSDPGSVTPRDYADFVARDLIWVAEVLGKVAGFSAGDDRDGTIWALFVDPPEQGRGLGVELLQRACRDLHLCGFQVARLTTDPDTRAERFYRRHGWEALGLDDAGEMQFQRGL